MDAQGTTNTIRSTVKGMNDLKKLICPQIDKIRNIIGSGLLPYGSMNLGIERPNQSAPHPLHLCPYYVCRKGYHNCQKWIKNQTEGRIVVVPDDQYWSTKLCEKRKKRKKKNYS